MTFTTRRSTAVIPIALIGALGAIAAGGCGGSNDTTTPAEGGSEIDVGSVTSERAATDPTPTDCGDAYLKRMEGRLDKYPQSDPRVSRLRQTFRETAKEACENNERAALGERPEAWECAALEVKAEEPPYSELDEEIAIECRQARDEE